MSMVFPPCLVSIIAAVRCSAHYISHEHNNSASSTRFPVNPTLDTSTSDQRKTGQKRSIYQAVTCLIRAGNEATSPSPNAYEFMMMMMEASGFEWLNVGIPELSPGWVYRLVGLDRPLF